MAFLGFYPCQVWGSMCLEHSRGLPSEAYDYWHVGIEGLLYCCPSEGQLKEFGEREEYWGEENADRVMQ